MSTEILPAISLQGVSRRFGEAYAVRQLDIDLAAGEFFALLGPSGCGKTTTLRMVGGFELPSTGRISLGGADVTMLPPYRRDVNTVFQSYALFPHLSVSDNVAFGLRRKGVSKEEARKRTGDYLELVGLAGFGARKPAQLSGGQQQRVALARALVNHPKVLLLDEPMGALDAKIRKTMQIELKRIQREVGITFLYVTHDQAEAMSMADRLAVMNAGLIEDLGAPSRVYDRPATRFVAEFLGSCNVIDLSVSSTALILPDGSPVEIDGIDSVSLAGGSWQLGIRPEKLRVLGVVGHGGAGTAVSAAPNRVDAVVTDVSYLGASTEARLQAPWGGVLQLFSQNGGDAASRIRPGDTVALSWDSTQCFVLPVAEGDASATTEEEVAA